MAISGLPGRATLICCLGLAVATEGDGMELESAHGLSENRSALLAIGVGGVAVGVLDLTQACILFGARIPLVIAAGLLGQQAITGGAGTYALGVFLHFFIALSFAAFYYAVSRKLRFMTEHPLVCGLIYGAGVEEVMRLVVLPLCALRARGPYELSDLIQGLLVHMVIVGLPIAYSVRRFAR
jgi:4-amino-4-deoxy-L-arabinose transferase-like glycosyltransferase